MNKQELVLARFIGERVALGKIEVTCPVCKGDPIRDGQLMSSVGDEEEELFCPGCDLRMLLKVKIDLVMDDPIIIK